MSDPGRKSFHTKIGEWMSPSIFKSKGTKVAEQTTDAADTAAREGQPDRTKSVTQSTADKFGRAKDRILHRGSARETKVRTRRNPFRRNKVKV